jgi:polar amino acid transport system substrate-binding protein
MRNKRFGAVVAAVALLVAGCGSPGAPVDPAPVGQVQRPLPPNVGGAATDTGGGADDDCNAVASLPADGTISPGSTMAEIRERGHLIVGVDQNTFLFGFRNPTTGRIEGFDIDIAKHVANAIFGDPERIQFKAINSAQREDVLKNGEVDIVVRTYSITCARKQEVSFSTVYYNAGQRILVKSNNDAVDELADLAGKRVCAAKGSTSLRNISEAEPGPVPVSVDNWSDCLVLLQQDQVVAVSTDDVILAGMAEQDPTTTVVGEPFTRESYGIGVPKDDEDMVRFVNAVLENVRDGGGWQASYDRWVADVLGPASPPKPTYR